MHPGLMSLSLFIHLRLCHYSLIKAAGGCKTFDLFLIDLTSVLQDYHSFCNHTWSRNPTADEELRCRMLWPEGLYQLQQNSDFFFDSVFLLKTL